MRAGSDRCELAVALHASFLSAALPALAAAAGHGLWMEPQPQNAAESAIRDAVAAPRFDGASARAEALLRISEQNAGTAASGLAQLAAGLILLESGRAAEATSPLGHPDVARTALRGLSLLALAQALEKTRDLGAAAEAYAAAAGGEPASCGALLGAAGAFQRAPQLDRAIEAIERVLAACPKQRAEALFALAKAYDAKGDTRAAALAYDRLDRELPASAEAREAAPRLRALLAYLPPSSPAERAARAVKKGLGLFDAGRASEAVAALRAVPAEKLSSGEADLVRVRLGRAFLTTGRLREAELALLAIRPGSAYEAEAAYHLAKIQERRSQRVSAYEPVAARFAGSEWAEEALLALANHYQKDARDEEALPYYRRLLEGYPEGRHVERTTWRVGWGDYRAGRYEQAAAAMEKTARLRPHANVTPALLYWSGRARKELGQVDRARALLDETYRRYKHAYHGIRAREALAQLPPGPYAPPPLLEAASAEREELPAAARERVRQLLLLERFAEAEDELRALTPSPVVQGTLAWLEWKRGRLRPAITALKRAYPEYIGEAGDLLPDEAWRILYPLQYGEILRAKAGEEGLDAALVAALVCQESTFDAGAVSVKGARGLMQIMPPTGRSLARSLGVVYQRHALHQPETSLDFGTRYLRGMLDRFGGRAERALAAYNAGPHRVDAWTAGRPEMSAEEFIESIPFTETRLYVMTILAMQEQYRRIYGLSAEPATAAGGERGTAAGTGGARRSQGSHAGARGGQHSLGRD